MENASKALLIAGEVLIAVLVLTFGIFIFANIKNISTNYESTRIMQEVQKENNKFNKYLNQELTAQEVVTVINMSNEYNAKMGTNIKIYIDNIEYSGDTIYFIRDNTSTIDTNGKIVAQKFLCKEIKYDDATGRIKEIDFEKVEQI